MGRVRSIRIRNFRSVGEPLELAMPERGPLVLVGANNAGKSNIVRAVDLLLGEGWPGSFEPSDHDHYGRSRDAVPIEITARVTGVVVPTRDGGWFEVDAMRWRFDPDDDRRSAFDLIAADGYERYGFNEARDQCFCMVIGADRRLQYQLSYTSKWTLLSRLMRRFHDRLIEDENRTARLRELFDGVVATFLEVDAFSEFSANLRRNAADFGANLEYALEIDFSAYDPSNFFHLAEGPATRRRRGSVVRRTRYRSRADPRPRVCLRVRDRIRFIFFRHRPPACDRRARGTSPSSRPEVAWPKDLRAQRARCPGDPHDAQRRVHRP